MMTLTAFHVSFLKIPQFFLLIHLPTVDENIDGIPLDSGEVPSGSGGFVKSKWEELDPQQVAHQAITTSKWELLQEVQPVAPEPPRISAICDYSSDSDNDSKEDSEERRRKLREIEVKVYEYQDQLESGERLVKSGWTIKQQAEHFRRKLMKKAEKNDSDSQSSTSRRERESSEKRSKKARHSPSSERERERHRSKRSRSISPPKSK